MLRMMRDPETGGPGPLARLLALMVLVAMVAISAPVVILALRWVVRLL